MGARGLVTAVPPEGAVTFDGPRGFDDAFDADRMAARLAEALLPPAARVTSCEPRQATYLPGRGCNVRYALTFADKERGTVHDALVTTRMLSSRGECERYMRTRLDHLALRVAGRPEVSALTAPVALLRNSTTVAAAWPVDGELPTLVDATDPATVEPILRSALPELGHDGLGAATVTVRRGHYGRRHRCVLRYDVHALAAGAERSATLYGKVAADGRGAATHEVVCALQARRASFAVPRSLGFYPRLGLALLEGVPGDAVIGGLVNVSVAGRDESATASLEDALDAAGGVLAALHQSGIAAGRARRPATETAVLRRQLSAIAGEAPELASVLGEALEAAARRLGASAPLPLQLAHGDYSHTQLLFDGVRWALVDYDTVCQAEPALDIGHFTAYLRVAVRKGERKTKGEGARLSADDLCERFVVAYQDASRGGARALAERARAYELVSLVRLALHSWQKFKPARLEHVVSILKERA